MTTEQEINNQPEEMDESPKQQEVLTKEEAENAIKARLKEAKQQSDKKLAAMNAEKEAAIKEATELKNRIMELEKKEKAGTITQNEQGEYQNIKKTANQSMDQGVPRELIPGLIARENQKTQFVQNVGDALDKDQEFKKLWSTGNPIHASVLEAMHHLDNAPAVLKHLLKDKKDHRLMELSAEEGLTSFTKFINDLSTKLEANNQSKPHPSSYSPAPPLTNIGESDQDFDIEDYIKNNPRF